VIARRQLPVHSPIGMLALPPAIGAALTRRGGNHELLAADLARKLRACRVVLTDSGTSALVLALRTVVGEGRTVALPGYACVDLVAAVRQAQVNVRLYDIDPATLSPDLVSLRRVLEHGVAAVVVAHLYGFPADLPRATELARAYGASVIEDAAQGGGGTLQGAPLGSFGALTVLSFGRGKGITGGRGGALLAIAPDLADRLEPLRSARGIPPGWGDLALAASQWVFGRPTLYSIPSAIPGLRLGEMVYRPAHDPAPLSAAAAALVRAALRHAEREAAVRGRNAGILNEAAADAEGISAIRPIPEGNPGYIRFPIRDLRHRFPVPRLGIMRAYPRALIDQEELGSCLLPCDAPPGAAELARSLFTLPVHSLVNRRDLNHLRDWLRSCSTSASDGELLARMECATTAK